MAAPATLSGNAVVITPSSDHASLSGMHFRLEPEFRIGGPPKSLRRKRLVKAVVVGALATAGWAAFAHQEVVLQWSKLVSDEVGSFIARNASHPVVADAPLPVLHLLDTSTRALDPPESVASTKPDAAVTEREATEEETTVAAPIERLPPPVIDPTDPYQARALAVGLHPGLSRALLAKLSAVDFENAARAIKTALAETPDREAFVWPRRRSPELAQFQVKFATSDAPDCRRYVVEIGKDGWMTTALPMEKCGIPKLQKATTAVRLKN